MPNTPRMSIPYPNKNETDWYDSFVTALQAIDAHMFAHREDRNLVMYSDATWTWNAATSLLSWNDVFYLTGAQSGGRWVVPTDSIKINDGEMFVVALQRYPQGTVTISTLEARAACEHTDEGCVICVRVGSRLYFRTGVQMNDGDSINIFLPGGGGGAADLEKHQRHMHSNGIVRSATATTALGVSVTDGGGAVDDTLDVAAVPGGDSYYVNGRERTTPAALFSFVNPGLAANEVRLYRAYMANAGDPQFQQRVTYSQPAAIDRFWVVQCSRGLAAGAKNIEFRTIVVANFWQVKFDGGPALLVPTAGLPTGVYRLYSADGINWIDIYIEATFDWTKVDAVSPLTVALTLLPEIDEKVNFVIGTAVAWMNGGWVQWGYGASSSVIEERKWGTIGENAIGDDFLKYIADRVGAIATSGVIFDHDAAWSERLGPFLNPYSEYGEVNFGLKYAAPNLTISGGKLLVNGQIYLRGGQTFQLALALAGVDYYLWWDLSDETMKITAATAFPTMWDGTTNPLAWILGGSTDQDPYLAGHLDRPVRGVPLYVFQQGGGGPGTLNEATLCDLRRNVTKAALKNHMTVGLRPDWQTANFVPFTSCPVLGETEAEFGCLDAAFRYINAMPHEQGMDEYGGGGLYKRYGRIIEVVSYTDERHWLVMPPDTELVGSGYSAVIFNGNAVADTTFFPGAPVGCMLFMGHGNSIKNLLVMARGDIAPCAALGLIGPLSGSFYGTMGKTVIENCVIYGSGSIGILGQTASTFSKPEVVIDRSVVFGTDGASHGVPGYGIYAVGTLEGINIVDSMIIAQDDGIYAATRMRYCIIDRCVIWATSSFGGPGFNWPFGYAVESPGVFGTELHNTQLISDHIHAVRLGSGGGGDASAIMDGCVTVGANLGGTALAGQKWVELRSTPLAFQDNFINCPTLDSLSTFNVAVRLTSSGVLNCSRNYVRPQGDALAWDRGISLAGGTIGSIANLLNGPNYLTGGVTGGIVVDSATDFKAETCFLTGFPGFGIDVAVGIKSGIINCSVNGLNNGNGIRAGNGVIEANRVEFVRAVGIHAWPSTLVKNNIIGDVQHVTERPEGRAYFQEYGAWGIRYASANPGTNDITSIHIEDNKINKVTVSTETGPDGHDLCCGIGPDKEMALPSSRYTKNCQFRLNEIQNVGPAALTTINTEFHGIAVRHPVESVSVDWNIIKNIGGAADAFMSYGIGVLQGAGGALPVYVEGLSFCHNEIAGVSGYQACDGIFLGACSKVHVDYNIVYGVYHDPLIVGAAIWVADPSVAAPKDRISICHNEIGGGSGTTRPPGYLLSYGIAVAQLNSTPINDLLIEGNQCDRDIDVDGSFITVLSNGKNFTIKHNQHWFSDGHETGVGIYVSPFDTTVENVMIDQNEACGEYIVDFIFVLASSVVHVADNIQKGFDGILAYGDGITLLECSHIDVHDNQIEYCYPDNATGKALIRIVDCTFGSVHDNVLRGPSGGANMESLRFEDTGPATPFCTDLHIHDNKISPHGTLVPPAMYDIGFYGAIPGSFGTDMTIWANVFGNSGAAGIENFSAGAFYVSAPAANNWNGGAFV